MSTEINGFIIKGSGTGNVTGPGSSTNNGIVLFNGTTGTLLADSGITVVANIMNGLSRVNYGVGAIIDASGLLVVSDTIGVLLGTNGVTNILQVTVSNVTLTVPLLLPTTGGTATGLTYYEQVSQNYVWRGIWTASQNGTLSITRIGNQVTLHLQTNLLTTASSSNVITTDAIPNRFFPANTTYFGAQITDNATTQHGTVQLSATGILTISTASLGAFSGLSNIGASGVLCFSVSYLIS
jgi:hypothetical protein